MKPVGPGSMLHQSHLGIIIIGFIGICVVAYSSLQVMCQCRNCYILLVSCVSGNSRGIRPDDKAIG